MIQDILNTNYWHKRLQEAPDNQLHHSIFKCSRPLWEEIEHRHQELLSRWIDDNHSVLDCGCGYGRLLTLLPQNWQGRYLGLDISPDFVQLAKNLHPGRSFLVGDLRDLDFMPGKQWDWAILISIRPMMIRNLGQGVWDLMQKNIQRVAKRLLFLEYDPLDQGDVL